MVRGPARDRAAGQRGAGGPAAAGGGVSGGGSSPLAAPGLVVLVPAYLFLGSMFVSVDLSTVDFAARAGYKPLAGVILGCYALGSATGGLWYGSRNWRAPAWKRLAVTLSLTVAGVCTFWAMPNLLVLAIVIYLCGLTIAPTLIAGYSLLESTALPGRATEAMSWLGTGISVGVALGATAVGFILDALGPRWGYAFAAAPASPRCVDLPVRGAAPGRAEPVSAGAPSSLPGRTLRPASAPR